MGTYSRGISYSGDQMCAADASLVVAPELSSVDGTEKYCIDETSEKWSLEQKSIEKVGGEGGVGWQW